MKEVKIIIQIDGKNYGTTSVYSETAVLLELTTKEDRVKQTVERLIDNMKKEKAFN